MKGRLLLLVVVLAWQVGCDQASSTSSSETGAQPDVSSAGSEAAAADASPSEDSPSEAEPSVSVEVASWDDVQRMVAEHQGKVVVVDIWSNWCVPCLREFPHLVELHSRYPDQVACISVNTNYDGAADAPPESHREKALEFLVKRRATFQNVICSDPDLELYDKIQLAAVPAIYVYDRSGELRQRFDNDSNEYGEEGFTYQKHVIPLVEQLLAAQPE